MSKLQMMVIREKTLPFKLTNVMNKASSTLIGADYLTCAKK